MGLEGRIMPRPDVLRAISGGCHGRRPQSSEVCPYGEFISVDRLVFP
jgi:hypothetical protein